MAEFVPPERLLCDGPPGDAPVALRGGETIAFAAFRKAVAGWRAAFRAQPGKRWALYFDDTFEFAAALFGAWHADKCVYLPADVQPATLARLQGDVDGFAGDVAPQYATLAPSAPVDDAWHALDPRAENLLIFTSGSSGEPAAIVKRLEQLFNEVATLA